VVGDFDVVASSFSAGLIDAAACGKPVIAFSTSGLAQHLGIQDVGPLVDDAAGLAGAVDAIVADYGRACEAALKLAGEHYYCLDDATGRLARILHTLARGGDTARLGLPVHDLA
jgi:glycosyltransferase involved in cell wall biosynthesis